MIGSSILVSILTLLTGLVSFLNQLVMARLFGASMDMDAYLIAVSIPLLVSGVLSAVLSYSLVPALIMHKADHVTYRRFAGLLLISLIIVAIVIACAGAAAAPIQISILGGSLSGQAQDNAVQIARISWLTIVLTLVVGHLNAMHNAVRMFLPPVVASMLPFIGMIVAGLAFGAGHGPLAIAWGMLAGYLMAIPMLLRRILPELDLTTHCLLLWEDVAGFLRRTPAVLLAMLCFTVYQSIDAYWAPQTGTGNLAYLGYAQRILVAIGSLVIAGPSAVLMPRLSEAHAEGRATDLLHDTMRAVRTVIAFSMPAAILISLLAVPLIRLCFERGAFDSQATLGVASVLPLMMLGMIAMLCVVIQFRALFAKHDIVFASMLGALATALYFVMSWVLSRKLGIEGIALSYALTWWLVLSISALMLWRGHMEILLSKKNLVFSAKLALLAVLTSVVVMTGRLWIGDADSDVGRLFLQLCIVSMIAVIIYFSVAIRMLGIEDIRLIYAFLSSKCASLMPRPRIKGV